VNFYHFKASWVFKASLVITEDWSHNVWLISIGNKRQFDEYYLFCPVSPVFTCIVLSIKRKRRNSVSDNSAYFSVTGNQHLKLQKKSSVLPLLSSCWIPIEYVICLFSFRKVSSRVPFWFKKKHKQQYRKGGTTVTLGY